ncbi:hypothetical protein CFOL_v3_31633 [Cephalotus follicularis]|uniref:Uncharacterized protein n=1 Tax=Cephalotus follicularis TaxID=3775 RepID=A0A1Q3D6U6_CEPFO|nr:hypothetical protein CFOL_v3_31633 [Cephalotus follicularis]
MVYSTVVATQQRQFNSLWEKIKDVEEGRVAQWLNNIPHDKWTLLYDKGRRWGDMTKNMVEIFNGVLKGARGLPIIALVQLSFYRSNSYFLIRRQDGQAHLASGAGFTPTIDAKLHGLRQLDDSYESVMFHDRLGVFEVSCRTNSYRGHSSTRELHVVDLGSRSYTYNEWRIYHSP